MEPNKRKTKGRVTPLDIEIGRNLYNMRVLHGLTQDQLAIASNISFQQIQKYEDGKNRISASRLCEFADLFNVPVTAFLPEKYQSREGKTASRENERMAKLLGDMEKIHTISKPKRSSRS